MGRGEEGAAAGLIAVLIAEEGGGRRDAGEASEGAEGEAEGVALSEESIQRRGHPAGVEGTQGCQVVCVRVCVWGVCVLSQLQRFSAHKCGFSHGGFWQLPCNREGVCGLGQMWDCKVVL